MFICFWFTESILFNWSCTGNVGLNVKYTFGWSCVIGWIGTIIAFLNMIITIVLVYMYLDNFTERTVRVRKELNMDNVERSIIF